MRKAQSIAARKEQHWAWLMVAPTIIGLLVLNYYPLIETFYPQFFAKDQNLWCLHLQRHQQLH